MSPRRSRRTEPDAICFVCETPYDSLEDAELCERSHHDAHDAHCGCTACAYERAADAAKEVNRD